MSHALTILPLGIYLIVCSKESTPHVNSCTTMENYQQEGREGQKQKIKAPFTHICILSSVNIYYVLITTMAMPEIQV